MMRIGENFCPGILHAVQAKDGLLTRIRIPGGLLLPGQFVAIAQLSSSFADGQVEITSRSNVQLRAIREENLDSLVKGLSSVGLLPSPQHDRVRNIVTSPFTGLAKDEVVDCRPFVQELDRRLIEAADLVNLPPKFNFSIDGGGQRFSRDPDDLALCAVTDCEMVYFHLAIGGVFSGLGVSRDGAVDCLIEAARACLRVAKEFDLPARSRKIASVPEAVSRLLDELSTFLSPCPRPDTSDLAADMPVGVYPTKRAGVVSVVPSIPLGRLTAEQTQCIAAISQECSGDLRLAPWRGVVLGAVPESSVAEICSQLRAVGLSYDGHDGYRGMAACAGRHGCDGSLIDVRGDASLLAERLSGYDVKSGWTVNISGCEKQCAMRNGATVELVANRSGYILKIAGSSIGSDYSPTSAFDAIVANLPKKDSEVVRGNRL